MAFIHGRNGAFTITDSAAAERDLSSQTTGVDVDLSIDIPDTTALGAVARRRQVVGLKDNKMSWSGFYDSTAATGSYTVFKGLRAHATASTVEWGPEGSTNGLPRITGSFRVANIKLGSKVDGVNPLSVELVADGDVTLDVFA